VPTDDVVGSPSPKLDNPTICIDIPIVEANYIDMLSDLIEYRLVQTKSIALF
jgi:hypothetical protein